MLAQILENKLFTDLSEQQQQTVVGGLQSLKKAVGTLFEKSDVFLLNQAGSGPSGSYVTTGLQENQVTTAANEALNAAFNAVPHVG